MDVLGHGLERLHEDAYDLHEHSGPVQCHPVVELSGTRQDNTHMKMAEETQVLKAISTLHKEKRSVEMNTQVI